MAHRLKAFLRSDNATLAEEYRTRAEWESSLGDEYTIRREVKDGVEVLVAYNAQDQVIGTYVVSNGREGGVNLETVIQEAYQPEDRATFLSAIRKVADKLAVPWKHVYYRFTLDPRYYDSAYDEEGQQDAEFGLGVTDSKLWLEQPDAVKSAFGLTSIEAKSLFAAEQFWQDKFDADETE